MFVSLVFALATDRVGAHYQAAKEGALRSVTGDPGVLVDPANAAVVRQLETTGSVNFNDTSFSTVSTLGWPSRSSRASRPRRARPS